MDYSKFNEVYKSLIAEEVENANKLQESNEDNKEHESHIDELTEENTTTIEENTDDVADATDDAGEVTNEDSSETEDEENGWGSEVENICSELIYQFDGFAYELQHCIKGSFTDARTPEELASYLEKLRYELDNAIEQLQSM